MIYLNGSIVSPDAARIDPADRGFTLADGLFETVRAYDGSPFRLADHLERMEHAAKAIGIPLPIDMVAVAAAVGDVLAANRLTSGGAALRITLTRGAGVRGLAPPADPRPTLMISASPYAAPADSCSAALVGIRRNEGSPLSRLKSLAYLDNVLAAGEAARVGAEEAVLMNNRGRIAGAARANLFALIDDRLVTPPIADGVLPGIARRVILELAIALRIPAMEQSLLPGDLARAREVWLTNSLFEIRSVGKLDDREIPGRELAAKLRSDYRELTRADAR